MIELQTDSLTVSVLLASLQILVTFSGLFLVIQRMKQRISNEKSQFMYQIEKDLHVFTHIFNSLYQYDGPRPDNIKQDEMYKLLGFWESLEFLVQRKQVTIDDLDMRFAYRFFASMNNSVAAEIIFETSNPGKYLHLLRLYHRWALHRLNTGGDRAIIDKHLESYNPKIYAQILSSNG